MTNVLGLYVPSNLGLRVRAFLELAVVGVVLRAQGLQRLAEWTPTPQSTRGAYTAGADEIRRAQRYADLIDSASRHHVVRSHCLQRSLVLHRWLRREGLPSQLRIGVRKENGELQAHAWVELDGQIVNDEPAAVSAFSLLSCPGVARISSRQSG